jgi:hypothetical protein
LKGPASGAHGYRRSRAIRSFALVSACLPLACAWGGGNELDEVLVHLFLSVSATTCLFFLARRPIIDPIQSFVLITYLWIGALPCVLNILASIGAGGPNPERSALNAGAPAAALAALGIPLYTCMSFIAVRLMQRYGPRPCLSSRAIGQAHIQERVLLVATCLWLGALALKQGLQAGDPSDSLYESVGFLGGSRIHSWWLGLFLAFGALAPFVQSALMWSLVAGGRARARLTLPLAFVVIVVTAGLALVGGWKSPLAVLTALAVLAWIARTQRVPVMILGIAIVLFLSIVVPFVGAARHRAAMVGADAKARPGVFLEVANNPSEWMAGPASWDAAVLSRGVYLVGSEAIRRSEMWSGPWRGETLLWGIEVQVPRPLFPNKRDMNIGNFVATEIGVDLELSRAEDGINNLAIFIPCEVAANFGWAAAWASFGLIGLVWAGFCCALLGVDRLADHPFSPMLSLLPIAMEQPAGHFLSDIRGIIFGLATLFAIRWLVQNAESAKLGSLPSCGENHKD